MDKVAPLPVRRSRNGRLVVSLAGLVVGMLGLSYAAVPLYTLFCRVTGYGGTTQVATDQSRHRGTAQITVRFDSNVTGGLGWDFRPEQEKVRLVTGETKTVEYRLTNETARTTVGIASFNVTPEAAGPYFNKLQCFCFTEQTLKPGETRDESVTFFIDPAIEQDEQFKQLGTITLSYTFFPAKNPASTSVKPIAAQETTPTKLPN